MREALALRLELAESRVQVIEKNLYFETNLLFQYRSGFKTDEQNGVNEKIPENRLVARLRALIFSPAAVNPSQIRVYPISIALLSN